MKKNLELKKTSVETVIKNVDKKREELETILSNDSTTVTLQMGETAVTIPIPFEIVKSSLKKIGCKNRTIIEVFGIKIAVDVS